MPDRFEGLSEEDIHSLLMAFVDAGTAEELQTLAATEVRFQIPAIQRRMRSFVGPELTSAQIDEAHKRTLRAKYQYFLAALHFRLYLEDIRVAREDEDRRGAESVWVHPPSLLPRARNQQEAVLTFVADLFNLGLLVVPDVVRPEQSRFRPHFQLPDLWHISDIRPENIVIEPEAGCPAELETALNQAMSAMSEHFHSLPASSGTLACCLVLICECGNRFSHLHRFYVRTEQNLSAESNLTPYPACSRCGSTVLLAGHVLALESQVEIDPLLAFCIAIDVGGQWLFRLPPAVRSRAQSEILIESRAQELFRLCEDFVGSRTREGVFTMQIAYSSSELSSFLQRVASEDPETRTVEIAIRNLVQRVAAGTLSLDLACETARAIARHSPNFSMTSEISVLRQHPDFQLAIKAFEQVFSEERGADAETLAWNAANLALSYVFRGAHGLALAQERKAQAYLALSENETPPETSDSGSNRLRIRRHDIVALIKALEAHRAQNNGDYETAVRVRTELLEAEQQSIVVEPRSFTDFLSLVEYGRRKTELALTLFQGRTGIAKAFRMLRQAVTDVERCQELMGSLTPTWPQLERELIEQNWRSILEDHRGGAQANLGRMYTYLADYARSIPSHFMHPKDGYTLRHFVSMIHGDGLSWPSWVREFLETAMEAAEWGLETQVHELPRRFRKQATEHYSAALEISERAGGYRFAAIQAQALAANYLVDGQELMSGKTIEKAVQLARRAKDDDVLCDALETMVLVRQRSNDNEGALESALERVELLIRAIVASGLRKDRAVLGEVLVNAALEAGTLALTVNRAAQMMEVLENAKSTLFNIELGRKVLRFTELDGDRTMVAHLQKLELVRERLTSQHSSPEVPFSRNAELSALDEQIEQLREEVRVQHPEYAQACQWSSVTGFRASELYRSHSEGGLETYYVGFFVAQGCLFWYSHLDGDTQGGRIDLGSEDGKTLEAEIASWLRFLGCLPALSKQSAETLGRLLEPAFLNLPVNSKCRIVVCPHGTLFRVPWSMVPIKGTLLADLGVLYVLPGMGSASALRRRRKAVRLSKILMLVNPQREAQDRLPGSTAEANAVKEASSVEVKILSGSEATYRALAEEITHCDVLHLGCHSEFSSSSAGPAARILLASSDPGSRNTISPEQITEELCADGVQLVNLSACSSGLLRTEQQTEMNGLATAFLAAGAQAVLASLWPLNDFPARRFSIAFYSALERYGDPGLALSEAQLASRSGALGYEMSKPYSWAGYILMGIPASSPQE